MLYTFWLLTIIAAWPTQGYLKPPSEDAFYKAPSNLASYQAGQIYISRNMGANTELQKWEHKFGTNAEVYQIGYKTLDTQGRDSHSIATVYKPVNPSKNPKIFSYQVHEDADNLFCSPSYALAGGTTSGAGVSDADMIIPFAISQGWYVVVGDDEGPKSSFFAGYEEGHAGLDAIRAALSFLKLPINTPAVLYGYSGGAHTTVWMTQLKDTYAPALNFVGAIYGGTPIDPRATVDLIDRPSSLFSGYVIAAIVGYMRAYPEKAKLVLPHFNEQFHNDIKELMQPEFCSGKELKSFAFTKFRSMANIDIMKFPPLVEILNRESLLRGVSSQVLKTPKYPRYIWHADHDEVIPVEPVREYVSQQCSDGADIQFVPWAKGEHLSTMYLGIPDSLHFAVQAFEGKTPKVKCGTPHNDIWTSHFRLKDDILGSLATAFEKTAEFVLFHLNEVVKEFDGNKDYDRGFLGFLWAQL